MARALILVTALFSQLSYASFDSQFYDAHYGLNDVYTKLVNNHGNGFEDLYGVRNFREVLKGVLYRGGSNNMYHRDPSIKRDNRNPLPIDGFTNLCEEGFREVIYLYATNWDKTPHSMDCNSLRGRNHINYEQHQMKSRTIMETVHAAIVNPERGPVYAHCWNGWHASGVVGAIALRQFCGVSGEAAVKYWERNTDGTDDGSYKEHKKFIREFTPYSDLLIDPATQARICPAL